MSTNIVYNGIVYTIPATNDVAWGDEVTRFLTAIPTGMLTKKGGSWALGGAGASDLDLGDTYGLAALYFKSRSAAIAASGALRLARADVLAWRNTADGDDLALSVNASDRLLWDSIELVDLSTVQILTNKVINAPDNTIMAIKDVNIAPDAAILYSKLLVSPAEIPWTAVDTVLKIKDSDIAPDAAIAGSKIDGDFGSTAIITAGGLSLGTTFHVTLKGDPSEDYDFEFPATDGTTGQALAKSAGGELEWVSIPGLGLNDNHVLVGNSSNLPFALDTSSVGDILGDEATGLTIKALAITNAMINASAGIAFSKLEALPLPLSGGTLTGLVNLDNEGVQFDTTGTSAAPAVGQLYYDTTYKSMAFKESTDTVLQIGRELYLYAKNNTGSIIPDGSLVYINSAVPDFPTVALARADAEATSHGTIGMTTEAISIGGFGRVTTFGVVNGVTTNVESDTSSGLVVADATDIYLSAVQAGKWVKTAPIAPNHVVKLGMVQNAGAGASGSVFINVDTGNELGQLHDVRITSIANRDTLEYDSSAGYWKNRTDVKQYTKEETGFVDPAGITITYDKLTQKITLTHATDIIYLYQGKATSLGTSYLTTAHGTDLDKKYFLYFNSAGAEEWFESFQGFDYGVYVAQVNYGTVHKFCVRECHGLMQWQVWEEFHRTVGTYIVSGGLVPAASWTANTYTTVAVTPAIEESVIADEDLQTTVPALTDGSTYTRLHFDSGLAVLTPGSALPFPNDGTNIQYNQNPSSGTALTAITTNARFVNVYCVHVPAAADADSQVYRHLFLTGQQVYSTLAAAQGEDFRTIVTGDLAMSFPEFIPYARITYDRQTAGGSGTTFNAMIPTGGVSYLVGNKAALASVSGFTPTDHNTLTGRSDADSHPASAITGTAVTLAGAEVITNKDIDGGTASNTSRISVPKNTTAGLAGLTRKEATLVYDSTSKKLNIDDGSALKVVGGGLVVTPVNHTATTLESGKHYLIDMSGASADVTVTLPAGAAESVVKVSATGNASNGWRVIVDGNAAEKIAYDSVQYDQAKIIYADQWAEFSWDSNDSQWIVNDASSPLSGTFSGPLTVTGPFTPSGGIVGKTDGVAVAAGYVGEILQSTASAVGAAASGTYKDLTSKALTPGRYTVNWGISFFNNGATNFTEAAGGIATSSGASTTDFVLGVNQVDIFKAATVAGIAMSGSICVDVSATQITILNSSTGTGTARTGNTLYVKMLVNDTAGGPPTAYGYITAIRTA